MAGNEYTAEEECTMESVLERANNLRSVALMTMSPNGRTCIAEEVHGVSCMAVEEKTSQGLPSEKLTSALWALDQFVHDQIPAHRKQAFLVAQKSPGGTYVNDPAFRLKFLRSKFFNVEEAAWLLIRYLDVVRELFGEICLSRPIRLQDIQTTKEERSALQSGCVQLLPFGDRAGRRILVVSSSGLRYNIRIQVSRIIRASSWDYVVIGTVFLIGRCIWLFPSRRRSLHDLEKLKLVVYLVTIASNDTLTQQKGLVSIAWGGQDIISLPSRDELSFKRKVLDSIPLRLCAFHCCFPDSPLYKVIGAFLTHVVGSNDGMRRIRFHVGNEEQLMYKLGTFGIPGQLIPITHTGSIKTGYFNKWIAVQKIVEELESKQSPCSLQWQSQPATKEYVLQLENGLTNPMDDWSSIITFVAYPGVNDVVFRRGTCLMHHTGNDYFQGLIQSKAMEHERASQTERSRLAWWIVDEIQQRNGRFLSWDQNGWWVVLKDESKIRNKVAIVFRDWKKQLKAHESAARI